MAQTFDFSVTATDLIRDALLMVGGAGEGDPVIGEQVVDSMRVMNKMLKGWQAQGIHLWTRKSCTVFLNPDQTAYFLGSSDDDDHWAEDYVSTTLSSAHVAGTRTVALTSTTGINPDDHIGIELDDGTRQWTTLRSTTLIADELSGAAASGNTVYVYTSRPQRPLRLLFCTQNDIPVEIVAFERYLSSTNKTANGRINLVHYQPVLTAGKLYIWQTSANCTDTLQVLIEHPIADVDVAGDEPVFPVEWEEAITYNLAVRLEPQYRMLSVARRQELREDAGRFLASVAIFDGDMGSIQFQPA